MGSLNKDWFPSFPSFKWNWQLYVKESHSFGKSWYKTLNNKWLECFISQINETVYKKTI